MPIISYAQNREDVLLNRVFPGPAGFYIDVGAALPIDLSVTKTFSDRGWSGVNVEPQEGFFKELVADRPRDVNLQVVLSAKAGTLTFFEAPTQGGMSTVDVGVAQQLEAAGHPVIRRDVPALTLAEVCERYVTGEIDFLKIDVEGEERNVLLGADFTRWRPRVLVIEATESGVPVPNHHLWEDVVLAAGYTFATFDGLNRYYVRSGDEALIAPLQLPVSVFDDFEPYETVKWRAAAETAEATLRAVDKNLQDVYAECERVRAAHDQLQAANKELWDNRTELWEKHVETYRKYEALGQQAHEAGQKAYDAEVKAYHSEQKAYQAQVQAAEAERRYDAAWHRLSGVRSALARLRAGLPQAGGVAADGRPAAVAVSHPGPDERSRILSPFGGAAH